MNRRSIALIFIVGMFLLTLVSAVHAAREDEESMVAKPTQELGLAAVTEGIMYIIAGGMGPIIILVIAFIIGMVISHLIWGGF